MQIRIADADWLLIARAADLDAIGLSTWIRAVAIRAARDRVGEPPRSAP